MGDSLKNQMKFLIGNLGSSTTSYDLKCYFSKVGEVTDCVVKVDPITKRSREFGFVTFSNSKSAKTELNSIHVLKGRLVVAIPWNSRVSSKPYVFLGNLPLNVDKNELTAFFSRYGKIKDISIFTHSKISKGCGFLEFERKEEAEKCIAEEFVYLCGEKIEISKANPWSDNHTGIKDCDSFKTRKDFKPSIGKSLDRLSTEEMVRKKDKSVSDAIFYSKIKTQLEFLKTKRKYENVQALEEYLSKFSDFLASTLDDDDDVEYGHSNSSNDKNDLCDLNFHLNHILTDLQTTSGERGSLIHATNSDSVKCLLCGSPIPDNSFETFFDHIKTRAHLSKVKERFGMNKSSEFSTASTGQFTITERENPQKKLERSMLKKNTTESNPDENLQMHAFSLSDFNESLALITSYSNIIFECKLCNLKLPPANNFKILFKQVWDHVNGKNHRKKFVLKRSTK